MLRLVAAYLVLIIFSYHAYAQEILGKHNEVLVQTSRPKLTDVDPSSNTGLVTVIKKEDFSSDAVSVADIVERQVGVQVRDLGGFGSFSSVSVRGSSSKQVNVYLDGVLLNGSYQGAVDLSQFLLGAVEQVEIYRGNVPIYLEQAGIGGAINIKTSGGARKAGGLLSSSLGSEGIKRAAASYKGSLDTLNYLFSAEHFSADNDYTVINTNDTPDYYADDYDQNKNNNDVVHTSLLASFNEQVNEAYRFSLTTQYSNKEQGVPEIQNLADNDATYDSEFFSMQANIEQHLRRGIVFNYSLYGLYKETIFRDEKNQVGLLRNDDRTVSKSFGGNIKASFSSGANLWAALLSAKIEGYDLQERIEGTSSQYQRVTTVVGLQDEWLSNSGFWLVNGSARGISVVDEIKQDQVAEFYHDLQLGLLAQLSAEVQFRANISRNIRLPELNEMYGDRGFTLGNEDLVEEKALNTDISLSYQSNRTSGTLALFYRDLNDAIVTIYNSRGIGKPQNLSKAQVIGIEVSNELHLSNFVRINSNLTFQDTEDKSNSRAFRGESLPGVYDFSGTVEMRVADQGRSVGLEYVRQSGGVYDSAGVAELPDVKQVNASLGFKSEKDSLEFKIKNVSGQRVSKYNRFPGPGRQWFVSYAHQF
ncbi:hypothetical protein A3749_16175 [Oleiphilus sp. HI0078]|uniref:TonB-dependent receptor plug domain-containing protein n=5 Tax=Oleiphilus TaxID=141450 RepID=UPI0007C39628|nr:MULTISPECIES: TonB-dependent receptor [unclassified Oleiphilus]KZY76402.1 hypothetical protein A3741_10945 [Oleiphilus sp. HI0069]KZY93447.1 hypothetical protein A3743_06170 [Oleiphilus sp. HI0072]KZZ06962.1 hypothetical protein A3749_16175 [Oleiphilus sp. HI0078]KZY34139.1 hypothetical protein A3729_00330 [Oleiphilus sp. HI0043]KZY60622.1 hypothetical protein A3735_11680 [Oleiphilus sp. HI0061]